VTTQRRSNYLVFLFHDASANPATCHVNCLAVPSVPYLFRRACLQAITLDGVLAAMPTCYTVRIFSAECACQCLEALLFSFEDHAIIMGKHALLNPLSLFLNSFAKAAISS